MMTCWNTGCGSILSEAQSHSTAKATTNVAFAQYESAEAFSEATHGAEAPIVLVRQLEWIDEPKHGHFIPVREERMTEWQIQWLHEQTWP